VALQAFLPLVYASRAFEPAPQGLVSWQAMLGNCRRTFASWPRLSAANMAQPVLFCGGDRKITSMM